MHGPRHRGRHPQDHKLFNPAQHPRLQAAVAELSWLYSQGYAPPSALKLVGDRHGLSERQRKAVLRGACSDQARDGRQARQVSLTQLAGKTLLIDGFNCLITVEAALAHSFVFVGRDGVHRDLASVHGTYRQVAETIFAAEVIGQMLARAQLATVQWYLDRPVSNSGRLRNLLLETSERRGWNNWQVTLAVNPDVVLSERAKDEQVVVATSDAWILDHCQAWIDLLGSILHGPPTSLEDVSTGPRLAMRPDLWLVDLRLG